MLPTHHHLKTSTPISSMDNEKGTAITITTSDEMFARARAPCRRRPMVTAFAVVALCYLTWVSFFRSGTGAFGHLCGKMGGKDSSIAPQKEDVATQTGNEASTTTTKAAVPLEAHIMSKCPDATASHPNIVFRICLGTQVNTIAGLPPTPRPPSNATSPSQSKLHPLLHRHTHR